MTASFRMRRWSVFAGAAFVLLAAPPVTAQYAGNATYGAEDAPSRAQQSYSYGNNGSSGAPPSQGARGYGSGANTYVPRGDAYPPPGGYDGNSYAPRRDSYDNSQTHTARRDSYSANDSYSSPRSGSYGGQESYGANDAYSPRGGGGSYGGGDAYGGNDAYGGGGNDAYARSGDAYGGRSHNDPGQSYGEPYRGEGYGTPYAPPPAGGGEAYADVPPQDQGTYDQSEIISAGHGFFGAISQSLGSAVEYAFKSQGRPNGYILGEDAGGAFVLGLRYGEGRLYTKDAGDHKVFWQGPTLGYDAGAEGSKTMVLVYNMRDPSEIYERFGGVQGAAYLVGGVSVQFQKYGDVTLAVIRSGVGLRLGANVGYLKYTRSPTWNPL